MTRFRALVLCYHAVSDSWPDPLAVPPTTLVTQIRNLLKRGLRPGTADDVLAGRRVLHVTFDDAYKNVSTILPHLAELGVPATVFACSAFADEGRPLDVPELVDRIRDFRHEAQTMNWDELRGISSRGVEIGSHTVSHPHLTRLSDSELERELATSKHRVEAALGRPCRFLAYPYGEYDRRVQAVARSVGYEAAFSLAPRERCTLAIPRVDIYRGDGRLRVGVKTSIIYRPLQALLQTMRSRNGNP